MTEHEWLTSTDPQAMLREVCIDRLIASRPGSKKISDRKLRAFCCACHRLFHLPGQFDKGYLDVEESDFAEDKWVNKPAGLASRWCVRAGDAKGFNDPQTKANTAALLRCVIGNPFRPVIINETAHTVTAPGLVFYRSWLTSTVRSLAKAAYDERPGRRKVVCRNCSGEGCSYHSMATNGGCDAGTGYRWQEADGTLCPKRLAVLADALEDAGCEDETILRWLRGEESVLKEVPRQTQTAGPTLYRLVGCPRQTPSYRGDWVLDLLLEKE